MLVQGIGTNVYKNNLVNFGARQQTQNGQNTQHKTEVSRTQTQITQDINDALKALGGKKLGIIIHNASAPSLQCKDVGTGSLYSQSSKKILLPFLSEYGFSEVQVDPEGKRPDHDNSPYVSNSFVYNPLIVDMEDLTKPENGALVDRNVYTSIVKLNHAKDSSNGDYRHTKDGFDLGFSNAWDNFKEKSSNIDSITNPVEKKAISALAEKFEQYKAQNGEILEPYAIYYNVLTPMFNNDYYANWPDEYNNLYYPKNEALISVIKSEHQDDIDKFMFVDMLAKQARDNGIQTFADENVKTIGDNPVGFSNPEFWANKGAFLPGYKIGCPPDGSFPEGQHWGCPVLHPGKMFNKDGSLGEAGQLLYDKCFKLAKDNQGGIRIDHLAGLIDPFVYKNKASDPDAGRLYSSPDIPELKQYAIPTNKPDSAQKFGRILEHIVLPACEDAGLTRDDIICENLGMPDHATAAYNRLGLGGMVVTIWEQGRSAKPNDTIMLGSHDNEPFAVYVNKLYGAHGKDEFNHKLWPAVENSLPISATHDEKQREFDKYRFDYNRNQPEINKQAFVEKKFTELFTSPAKRVQIFWTDLLGMQQKYNVPNTSTGNWSLRLSSDFEKQFDPTLIIKSLSSALKAQDAKTVKANQQLIDSLDADVKALSDSKKGGRLYIQG